MMLRIRSVWLLIFALGLIFIAPQPGRGQVSTPIDVFLDYRAGAQQLDVFFANPATGLSSLATINNFAPSLNPLDEVALTANGVIYRDPTTGQPGLITPNGRIFDISFIPQSPLSVDRIDWALSDDGRVITWAEIQFTPLGWESSLYIANLDGQHLRTLPARPILPIQATHRVAMLGVSNDRQRVFYDAEHLPEIPPGNLFEGFQRVTAYLEQVQTYFDLPGEPSCVCPAMISDDGDTLIRLTPSGDPDITGFDVHIWNLENNRERLIEATNTGYNHAGPMLLSEDSTRLLVAVGNDQGEEPVYSVLLVDLVARVQQIVRDPLFIPLRPMALIDNGSAAIVVSVDNNLTYKLDFATAELTPVADKMWLGQLEG